MNDYTKGILTGASLILCFFMLVSAKSQSDNLGDITVNSIMVLNDGTGGGGTIKTFNPEGKETAYLGGSENGNGILEIINADGKQTVYLGGGAGTIRTYNAEGKLTAYLGTDEDGDGTIRTSNADGKKTSYLGSSTDGRGWLQVFNDGAIETSNADGKKTSYLGVYKGGGYLSTYNKHGIETAFLGTNIQNDGVAYLRDRYGDVGWEVTGKK